MIELVKQVFECAGGITRISGGSKELPLALLAPGHGGNLALVFQDDEVALWHGADSLSQFRGLYHSKESRLTRSSTETLRLTLASQEAPSGAAMCPEMIGLAQY